MGVFDAQSGEGNAVDTVLGVDSTVLHDAVADAVAAGWLLSFGASRDGGAASVTVLHDDGKERLWAATPAEFERALVAVQTAAKAASGGRPPTGGERAGEGASGASDGKPAGRASAKGAKRP